MKIMLFLWLLQLMVLTGVDSTSSSNITLKSIYSTLCLESTTGSLLSLSDVKTGEEFVKSGASASIFRLNLVNKSFQPAGSINAIEFSRITLTQQPSQHAASFHYMDHPNFPELQCFVSFRVESVDGTFRSRLNCSSVTSNAIRVASFPQFDQPSKLKSPDSIAMPWYEGIILNDPGLITSAYNSTFSKATNSNGETFPWTQYVFYLLNDCCCHTVPGSTTLTVFFFFFLFLSTILFLPIDTLALQRTNSWQDTAIILVCSSQPTTQKVMSSNLILPLPQVSMSDSQSTTCKVRQLVLFCNCRTM